MAVKSADLIQALSERQQATERQLGELAGAVKALQARVAELSQPAAAAAIEVKAPAAKEAAHGEVTPEMLVVIAAVSLRDVSLEVIGRRPGEIGFITGLVEDLDLGARDGDVDQPHLDMLRETSDQGPAKIVSRTDSGPGPAEGREGGIPTAAFPFRAAVSAARREIDRRKHLQAVAYGTLVLLDCPKQRKT